MLEDIDQLMTTYGVDALYLQGKSLLNPDLYYMSRFLAVDPIYFVKLPNQAGILAASDMVCERAKEYSLVQQFYSLSPTMNKALSDRVTRDEYVLRVITDLVKNLLPSGGVIGISNETSALHIYFLQKLGVEVKPVENLFLEARETKDIEELKAIEQASQSTEATFRQVIEIIQNSDIGSKNVLMYEKEPLTVGRVKRQIEHGLVDNDSENSEESIVAAGIKGADFHYLGMRGDVLHAHEPIIVDIFPRHIEERYHADITRTIVRGNVSTEVRKLFESVEGALDAVADTLSTANTTTELVEAMANSFERDGHQSVNRTPNITEGMLHALGHGIGLNVHEAPWLSLQPNPLKSSAVIAIEPALYYKKIGGIRIEDDMTVTSKGSRILTKLPRMVFL
ncbi:MAG: M24 family metallopeptidase [Promethearchaeota archaeon]